MNILNKIDKDITVLLDNLPVGIIRLNKNKECIYVNKFIYDFFKISQNFRNESTILYEIFRRIHPEDLDKFRLDDERFLVDHIEGENTFRIWRENIHDLIWVTNKKILIQNDQSQDDIDISYMYTFQDVDETKTMEIQLRNERLKVEQAYNYKSIFLANNSHELRTPINGIVGMLTLLEGSTLSTEQQDYINMIKECSFNLMTIINDILDYSKLEIGKIVLDNKAINIQKCIESVNDIIISRIIEKSIDYSYNLHPDIPIGIISDCNRLKQIILNLLINSIKFTESGSIFLNVEHINKKDYILLKRHSKYEADEQDILDPEDTVYLRFDITDTGCGIDITQKDKLFKSFSQVDTRITNKIYQGTGLGLAISKELVELMGGYIWLDWSEINNGSRFSFVIKTNVAEGFVDDSFDLSDNILHDIKVLILDDNVHNRISLTAMVNKWGMKAYSFSNTEEALYFTKITQFDIGLIDVCMPKLDGQGFAKQLREIDEFNNKTMPLIALSSLGEKLPNIDKNFVCYLTKPVKELRLKQKCKEIAKSIKNTNANNTNANANANDGNANDANNTNTNNTNANNTNANNTVRRTLSCLSSSSSSSVSKSRTVVLDPLLEEHVRSSVRILLAEDVYINQKVMTSFLSKLGFANIEVVENGVQCFEILKDKEFDLVLLDIRMPMISGDTVLNEINEYYKINKDIKTTGGKFKNKTKPYVIAVTAYCLKDDKNKYLEMGFDDYIPKPINFVDLTFSLNKFLTKLLY